MKSVLSPEEKRIPVH